MSLSSDKSLAEKINTWMPIVGVVIAAIWGVYTFAFKEMIKPNSAPVNITMNLQFKKLIPPNAKKMSNDEIVDYWKNEFKK